MHKICIGCLRLHWLDDHTMSSFITVDGSLIKSFQKNTLSLGLAMLCVELICILVPDQFTTGLDLGVPHLAMS